MIRILWKSIGKNGKVFLENKHVGNIKKVGTEINDSIGYQYFPKGQKKGGEIFKRISDCEHSLKGI